MKIRPALRRRHEPEQRHSTGRFEEKLPVRKRKENQEKTNSKHQSPQRTKGRAAQPDLSGGNNSTTTLKVGRKPNLHWYIPWRDKKTP
jgi:hypothetical protein